MLLQSRNEPGRRLTRVSLLAAALLIAPPSVPGAGESDRETQPAPHCRADGVVAGDDGSQAPYPTVDPSIPGWWRQELKLQDSWTRVPGSLALQPRSPAPAEASTEGRWVTGYRPATPRALAELEAWKEGRNSTRAGDESAETPRTSGSNYAANLMAGERVAHVPEEPITRIVRTEEYPIFRIDVGEIGEVEEEKPRQKGPASEFHHGSGMTWNDYLLVKELAKTSPTTPDGQAAASQENLDAPGPTGIDFDAIQSNFTSVPPDPIMAAGPNHLVAIVNTRYQVWDKSGTPLIDDITLNSFFDGVPDCSGVFDVFVDYDEAGDRFVMGGMALSQSTGTDSFLCVAATATNDPTGVWNRASFRADANATHTWIDFPHMAIGLDAIYIAGNMFLDGGGLDHVRAYALDKDDLYDGTPLSVAEANLGTLFFTAQPAKIHGFSSGGWPAPGTPHHFIAHDGGGNSRIWRWGDPFVAEPVIYGTVAEENFNGVPPNAPELGGTSADLNDTGSAKWLDAEYRGGKLWTTRNVACDFGGGDSESCIDWIQVDVSGASPVLEQQQTGGAYGSVDDFRYYPDISVDRNNNIAIGYTKSSATTYTEVWVTGREFDDPPGTLQTETLQRAGLGTYVDGSGCQGSCDRWGDYTGLTVDPDGCTFWYLGQYSDGGYYDWGTHIGSFKFDSCSVDSSLQVDKGTYTCNDSITVSVTDSTPIDAATVSAGTTISASGGDSETVPAGSWTGSDCTGGDCGTWTVVLPVSGNPGSPDDGTLNVDDGETITAHYADPHPGHTDQTRNVAVVCATRLEDGGYIVEGGCEGQQGPELYRDYMDGGEYISYTFGIYNPQTAPALTDVETTLSISGPAADKVTIFNPTIYIGSMGRGALTAPVFQIYIDPSIDAAGFRMSDHDFNLNITSAADGFTEAQVLPQSHLLQTDDNIVTESQCWNFESGDQGFVNTRYVNSYNCGPPQGCSDWLQIDTVTAPWTHGGGCGSETRDDYPEMSCDTAGSNAFMSNTDAGACNDFAQSTTTLTDDLLYSPIFAPANTGTAASGQPWYYRWRYSEWFYRSDMVSGANPAMAVGLFWADDYQGIATPAFNEIDSLYNFFYGYFHYANQGWDSGVSWDPDNPPANIDGIAFGGDVGQEATPGTQWRWAVEVYDADIGGDPTETPATAGLSLDNLNLVYDQYHAEGQIGACVDSPAVVSIDRFTYLECPTGVLGVSVLDGNATSPVRVTVTSRETGDSETFSLSGSWPYFAASLPYSTAGGPGVNDGTLFVTTADLIRATYVDDDGVTTSTAYTAVACQGGDVVTDGVAGVADNGDGDSYADTNETVDLSIRIRNNTDQPLHNVTATIVSDDPTVDCIIKDSASFGTIAAGGGTASNDLLADPFTFKVSYQTDCTDPASPPTASFRVLILADDFAGPIKPQTFTMFLDMNDLPGTVTFVEDFTTDPPGFSHQLGPGDDDGVSSGPGGLACSPYVDEFFWRDTGGNPGGGYFCWEDPADDFPNGTYSDLNDSALYSRVFKIGSTSTTLSFDHEYEFGWSGEYRVDGARVDYSVNGGVWQKMTTLPYDGTLIWNTYCSPLCNGTEFGLPCFTETIEAGENIFNQLDQGTVTWTNVSGDLTGLTSGDQVRFRWRVGSMNSSVYGISTQGGYGLDNVTLTNVIEQVCDTATNPDVGCGVAFESSGNLVQICGDDDALVEPSEEWSVDVTLRNSSAGDAVNTTADLVVNSGSAVLATVTGNPGSYGTLAAAGGTGTATYQFTVDPGASCVNDITFDVENIADNGGSHRDQPLAFTVQAGGIGSQEVASQSVSPLTASDEDVASPLAPPLTTPVPAHSATVDYDFNYTNMAPQEIATQDTDPLVAENGSTTTWLSPPFTIGAMSAVSAVVDWTSLSHSNVDNCTRVFLRLPAGFDYTLKEAGSPPANPYDVMTVYASVNGGPGQYRLGLEEVASGPCKNQATLSGGTMTVTGPTSTGSWTLNAGVVLWDGTSEHILKDFGTADAAPYDVTSTYDAAGPGTYELRLYENGAGGVAELSGGTMTVEGVECDLGCATYTPPAPPMADGYFGSAVTLKKGIGPDDLELTFDNTTCSASRAVVVYGTIGDYSGYQGTVDTGCDMGTGPTATVSHAGDDVWFNVIWVNEDDAAGHPGYDSGGSRSWDAAGLCGVVLDDPGDGVCD